MLTGRAPRFDTFRALLGIFFGPGARREVRMELRTDWTGMEERSSASDTLTSCALVKRHLRSVSGVWWEPITDWRAASTAEGEQESWDMAEGVGRWRMLCDRNCQQLEV